MRKSIGKTLHHPRGTTGHFLTERGISFTKPRRQTDATRQRVQLRNAHPALSVDEVRPDHARQRIATFLSAGKFDQLGWFAEIEITRDPGGLLPFDALLVELIAGALKNEELMTEPLEIAAKFFLDRKRFRCNEPVLFREKSFLGTGIADGNLR